MLAVIRVAGLRALIALLVAALAILGLSAPPAYAIGSADASLTVTVTSKAGTPLTGIAVTAYPVTGHHFDYSANYVDAAPLGGGKYAFNNTVSSSLDSDRTYALYFSTNPASTTTFDQYLGGAAFLGDVKASDLHSWNAAQPNTLSVSLATNAIIAGKVTNASGIGLGNVKVVASRFNGVGWDDGFDAGVTASTGVYALRNLDPGSYRLTFTPDNTTGYLERFSGNVATFAAATSTYVGLGATAAVNAVLPAGGSISGTTYVYLDADDYFYGDDLTAIAYPWDGANIDKTHPYESKPSSSLGKWVISGLPAGAYKVKVYSFGSWVGAFGGNDNAIAQWTGNSGNYSDAPVFTVVAGKTTAMPALPEMYLLDSASAPDSSAHLYVNDGANPVGAADIYLENLDGDNLQFDTIGQTDGNGIYDFPSLPIGDYRLWISKNNPDGTPVYQPYMATESITTTGTINWTVALDAPSAFQFTTGPAVASADLAVDTGFTASAVTTMDDGTGLESDTSYDYQWMRDGAPIWGAISSLYVARAGDVGHTLSVMVTAHAFGYPELFSEVTAGAIVAGPAPVNTGSPTISSPVATPVTGTVLTAGAGSWDQQGLTFTYQWFDNDVVIPAATARTYVVAPADGGNNIRVDVQAHRVGHADSAAASSTETATGLLPGPVVVVAPTVSSTTVAGKTTYTVHPGTRSVPGVAFHYSWNVDGAAMPDSPAYLYDPASDGADPLIQVVISAVKPGYVVSGYTLVARKANATAPTPTSAPTSTVTDTGALVPTVTDTSTVEVGHLLQVVPLGLTYPLNDPGVQTIAYQWQRSSAGVTWTNIIGATKSFYTVAAADVAQKLRVNVTITSTHFATFVDPSPAGTGVANTSLANGSVGVDIVGSGAVTTVNTAKVGGVWGSPSPVLTYRWYACDTATAADCSLTNDPGFVPIVPAVTTASYTPPVAMAPNHFLQVRVTGSKPSYVPFTILSLPVQVKLLSKPSIITPPKVAAGLVGGTAIVGKVLTAGPSVTDVITTHAYSWQTCDDNPAGNCTGDVHWQAVGTGASYTVKPGDFTSDGRIRVVDTATKAGLGSTAGDLLQSSLDYPVAVGALVNSVLPKATITPSAATVTSGTWTPAATFDYQWYVDGNPALTGPTLSTPPAAASLSVAVTAHAPGYADKTVTQIVRKGVVPTATGAVTGTFLVGSPLTAPATPITFPGPISSVVTTYMWYSNGALIAGQTAQTFTPSGAYVGKTITAHTTIATAQYATVTANDTGPIGQLITTATAATGTPVIVSNTGHLLPGATLSVPVTSYSPTGLTFAYKWEYFNGTSWVLRAATPTVLLTTADAGRDIRVTVTATKLGYLPSALTAPTASIGYLGPLAALTGPTLTGAGVVGSPLAIAVTWNTPPTTVAYQWYRNGVPLPGATGVSFTPTATSLGDEIRATVTVTKPGYANQTFGSQIVQVGIAAAPIGTIPVIAVPTVPARAPLGSPKVGDTLTASTGVWNVDGLTFHYDWRGKYAGDPTAYPLGTGPTYTPTVIDGPLVSITVTVTATRDGYAPSLAYTSVATKPVVP